MTGFFGLNFTEMTLEQVALEVTSDPDRVSGDARWVVTANVAHIVTLSESAAFRSAYKHAWLITADGAPVVVLERIFGERRIHRITGADLVRVIVERLQPGIHRPYFVAPNAAAAQGLATKLGRRGFEGQSFRCYVAPPAFEPEGIVAERLAADVRDHDTTHLFLGIGAPKSEIWLDVHRSQLGPLYAFAFGAGLEFLAGVRRRAPNWMQHAGLEWAWRMGQEPRRLGSRYLTDGLKLSRIVLKREKLAALMTREDDS